jgi:hypothetical protein
MLRINIKTIIKSTASPNQPDKTTITNKEEVLIRRVCTTTSKETKKSSSICLLLSVRLRLSKKISSIYLKHTAPV